MNLKQLQVSVFIFYVSFIDFTKYFDPILCSGDTIENKVTKPALMKLYILVMVLDNEYK